MGNKKFNMPSKEELVELYKTNTVPILADNYFVSTGTVANWLRQYKISKENAKFTKEIFADLINAGMSVSEIASKLDCSLPTVRHYLKAWNLKELNPFRQNIKDIDKEEIYKLRVESLWSMVELAELYKVSLSTISVYLARNNFPVVRVERAEDKQIKLRRV